MEKKQENNKKRSIIVVAMILLLLLLIAFCGFTFAKYITSTTVDSQSATAAKWGFIVTADGTNLFKKEYTKAAATEGGTAIKLVGSSGNVVAPGTSGYVVFSVKGSAEVRAQINIALTNDKNISLKQGESEIYAPIVWNLYEKKAADADYPSSAKETGTLEDIQNALTASAIEIGTTVDSVYKLEWSWAFENPANDNSDRYDSLIGWASQGAETYDNGNVVVSVSGDVISVEDKATATAGTYTATTEIELGLTISVEQVNE